MTHWRDDEPDQTLIDQHDHDVAELEASSRQLLHVAEQVDEVQRAAIDLAVAEAVARAKRVSRRTYWLSLVATFLLAVAVSLPVAVVGYIQGRNATAITAQFAAGDAASTEVTSARASSLLSVRRDLASANVALAAAGLTPVPDPGAAASAYQVAIATAEALGTLRSAGELEKRGVPIAGVTAPDPAGGRFPDLRYNSAGG